MKVCELVASLIGIFSSKEGSTRHQKQMATFRAWLVISLTRSLHKETEIFVEEHFFKSELASKISYVYLRGINHFFLEFGIAYLEAFLKSLL